MSPLSLIFSALCSRGSLSKQGWKADVAKETHGNQESSASHPDLLCCCALEIEYIFSRIKKTDRFN